MAPLKYSIKDFKFGEKLGKGGFGHVYHAECLKPGSPWKYVAIKKISKEFIASTKIQDRVTKEKEINRNVDHPNIVKCYTTVEDKDFTYFVLELCQFTLEEYLKKEGPLIEVCAFEIIKQIVSGLDYLHCNNIMHRDLSLRNILVTADKRIKLADFGLSILLENLNDQIYSIVGTPKFQSPEMHNQEPYDVTSEFWSLGVVIVAVLGGELPPDSKDIKIPKNFSPEAHRLVTELLKPNKADRLDPKGVMESSFFKKYKAFHDPPTKGIGFNKSTRKNGSSRDSGMDSFSTSFATTEKYSHQSQQHLDSGFDYTNESTKSRNNHNISLLSTIHSSEHSYQSNQSKTRSKHDVKKHLKPILEKNEKRIATISNKCVEPYSYRDQLKIKYQTLPSRHIPIINNLPYETTSHTGYADVLFKEQNPHAPLHPAINSDRRERSASEEQRKKEHQRLQHEMKKSYSGEAGHGSHYSRDRSKTSQKKSSEKNSQLSSPHRDKYFSTGRSNLQTENSNSQFQQSKYSNLEDNYGTKKNLHGKVHQETSTLKPKPLPLNTERLRPCRYPMKKIAVVSILENGEVCVEWLKTKKEKYVSDVVFISNNGRWIYTYKPHDCLVGSTPPPKPNDNKQINSFPYDDLPPNYWKMYRKAKILVDFVRATTPRITYYDKESKCVMMENYPNPDFEMEFFDGGNISQKSNKVTITDEWGQTILLTELIRSDKHFAVMWDKFCKMKEWCKNMEAQLEALKSNCQIETLLYPVMFGNPPLLKKRSSTRDNFKENIVLHSSEQPATSKNKYSHNSYEKHNRNLSNSSNKYILNTPSSYSLATSPSNIDAVFKKLISTPKLIKGEVYVEYKDGYSVRCSTDQEIVRIYDSRKNCVYDSRYNDKSDSLIDVILQDLPSFVPVAVFCAMMPTVT